MGYFQVRYDSRGVNYDHRGFIRLVTGWVIRDWTMVLSNRKVNQWLDILDHQSGWVISDWTIVSSNRKVISDWTSWIINQDEWSVIGPPGSSIRKVNQCLNKNLTVLLKNQDGQWVRKQKLNVRADQWLRLAVMNCSWNRNWVNRTYDESGWLLGTYSHTFGFWKLELNLRKVILSCCCCGCSCCCRRRCWLCCCCLWRRCCSGRRLSWFKFERQVGFLRRRKKLFLKTVLFWREYAQ